MRIGLVSPYSWTYPGGVLRHAEALAHQFMAAGHDVRLLAPHDPDDRLARVLHRGAQPQRRELPDWVVPLGRTVGIPANGAISNVSLSVEGFVRLRRELRTGGYDVVHIQDPTVPVPSRDALVSAPPGTPLVGTYHCYSENPITNGIATVIGGGRMMNRLHVRIAVSHAAEWTGRRYFGGRYRIIPNGVDVPESIPAKRPGDALRVLFVGQAVERKGLPVLLRAFEALRAHVPAELRIVGATEDEVAPLALDQEGVTVLGKVDDEAKRAELLRADVLCAPSLGGESFGMVLTEAFAAGTPVVASDIAGYRDVVADGESGVLIPVGDATALASTLRDLWDDPARRAALGTGARAAAPRFAWPRVAGEVLEAYEDAVELAARPVEGHVRRAAMRIGALPADGGERVPPRRLPSLEPDPTGPKARPVVSALRRLAVVVAAVAGLGLAYLALRRLGLANVARPLLASSPSLVLLGLGLMCASMVARAVAWHATLRAALPAARTRLFDALQGTSIGVLMSATLPARLGEPSRALIVARRTGRPRDNLPVVLGTMVSQTLLNLVALTVLGAVMFSSVDVFQGHERALLIASIAPLAILVIVIGAPVLLGRSAVSRSERVHRAMSGARRALARVRTGLEVFRQPRLGALAAVAQLGAWALQWLSCYVLLVALGLDSHAGVGAAAAVLFAVNVTAVLPATPANLGVFQAACVAVLHGAYHVSSADALGYGIVLQAVEIATAVAMGGPALLKEGLSWRDVRARAMHASPATLPARSSKGSRAGVEA